jgi:hypothetical protein
MMLWLLAVFAPVHAQEIVTLSTRAGVTQSYFLSARPEQLVALAVLFPGSGGLLRLRTENGRIRFNQGNFLVRSRSEFVKRGVIVALVDAPSDQQSGWGMSDEFRLAGDHTIDMAAVIGDLKRRFGAIPQFLIGTSRGTISAAALGARLGQDLAGVVLTATMFRQTPRRAREAGPGLSKFDFATIKLPLLFVHHASDGCEVTPYGDAARLSNKYPLITVLGGTEPQSGPCEPFSQHGFLGKEPETVAEIVNWMLQKPFREKVR